MRKRRSYRATLIDNEYRRRLKEKERKEKQNSTNRGNYYGYTRNDK